MLESSNDFALDQKNQTDLVDQSSQEGLRNLSRRCPADLPYGFDDRGGKADIAKPMIGLGSGIFEIALPKRGNAYGIVYALQLGTTFGWFMPFKRNRSKASRRRKTKSNWWKAESRD